MNASSDAVSGRLLYHAIWETIRDRFYDPTRLGDWASWEHRFDDQIEGEESAIAFAEQAIASTGDPYTKLRGKASAPMEQPATPGQQTASEPAANVTAVVTPDGIGYLRILSFYREDVVDDVEQALQKLAQCNGIIVDLRNNPGGLMAAALDCCELFLRDGEIATVETQTADGVHRRVTRLTPDVCLWIDQQGDSEPKKEVYKRRKAVVAGKPLVFLLSGITASSTELFVCAVVVNGFTGMVTTVGKPTLGKGIGQSDWIDILGKVELRVSSLRWLAPTGDWLGDGTKNGAGIEPEFLVADDRGPEGLKVAADQIRLMVQSLRDEVARIA